jgi:hypothetical protein
MVGLRALGMVSAGDLAVNIIAGEDYSVSARCPDGHPPWRLDWLPNNSRPAPAELPSEAKRDCTPAAAPDSTPARALLRS